MLSYSMTSSIPNQVVHCLNPCSNGICSLTLHRKRNQNLVSNVLILVLMEYALLPTNEKRVQILIARLNPCSNGICSLTVNFVNYWESKTYVAKSISKTVFLTKINYIFWGCKIRNFFVPRQKNQYFFNDFLWNIFIFLKITFLHGLENWETLRLFNFQDVKDLYFSRLKIRIIFFNCKIFWRFFSKKRWTFFLSTFLFLRPVNILRSFLRSSEKNRKKSELSIFCFLPK